ncbi:MAG: fatty acid desaturase, partial [Planctomycetales bacterium]
MGDSESTKPGLKYSPVFNFSMFMLLMYVAAKSWHVGWWGVTVCCWPLMWHLGHTMLLAFHEAVHYNLSPNLWANEIRGFNLGVAGFIPLSVYRQLHAHHHARLSTEQDAELWPYNQPSYSRPFRIVCAFLELTLAYFFIPLMFLRGILVDKHLTRELRNRIILEYAGIAAIWSVILGSVFYFGWQQGFVVGYVVPAIGAANLQALRLFIEHMGLLGNSPMTLSRTVVHE